MSTPFIRFLKKERHTLNGWIRIDEDRKWNEWWDRITTDPPRFGLKPAPFVITKIY